MRERKCVYGSGCEPGGVDEGCAGKETGLPAEVLESVWRFQSREHSEAYLFGRGGEIREGLQYQGCSVMSRQGLEVLGKDSSEEGKLSGPDWRQGGQKGRKVWLMEGKEQKRHCLV